MTDPTRYRLSAELRNRVQSTANALGKPCYVALMRDGSLVIGDNLGCTKGARQDWVFNPATTTTDTP